MRDAKKLVVAVLVLVAAVALTACGSSDDGATETSVDESGTVTGSFEPLPGVPRVYAEVKGEAELERTGGGTVVSISLSWLEPETRYTAHLHTGGCDQPDPGGPHFQFEPGGSEEPPNELHLKFTTDSAGDGEATTSSKREVPVGEAGSLVIHLDESHEMTASGTGESEAIFVHEGVDHSKEGPSHKAEPEHAHSDKVACAELEGAAAGDGEATADVGNVPTIEVRNGEPVGGVQELEFDAGEDVRFRVSSDQAEEIHVHGYDISQDVPAGGTTEFDFPAEIEGIFEAELEALGVQILELRINP